MPAAGQPSSPAGPPVSHASSSKKRYRNGYPTSSTALPPASPQLAPVWYVRWQRVFRWSRGRIRPAALFPPSAPELPRQAKCTVCTKNKHGHEYCKKHHSFLHNLTKVPTKHSVACAASVVGTAGQEEAVLREVPGRGMRGVRPRPRVQMRCVRIQAEASLQEREQPAQDVRRVGSEGGVSPHTAR